DVVLPLNGSGNLVMIGAIGERPLGNLLRCNRQTEERREAHDPFPSKTAVAAELIVDTSSTITDPLTPAVPVKPLALTSVAGVTAEPFTDTLEVPNCSTPMLQVVPDAGAIDAGIVAVTATLLVKITCVPQSAAAKLYVVPLCVVDFPWTGPKLCTPLHVHG